MKRTRAALRNALLALLEKQPFDQITIREITRVAGVGYVTFFRHYPGKEALLDELASDEISTVLQLSLPVLYETDSRASTIALCSYVAEHRELWLALLTGGAAGIVREAFLRQAKEIPVEPSRIKAWLPEDFRVIHATTSTVELLAWWLQARPDLGAVEVADILNRLVIAPAIAPGD